jgi:hypothetical protein
MVPCGDVTRYLHGYFCLQERCRTRDVHVYNYKIRQVAFSDAAAPACWHTHTRVPREMIQLEPPALIAADRVQVDTRTRAHAALDGQVIDTALGSNRRATAFCRVFAENELVFLVCNLQ